MNPRLYKFNKKQYLALVIVCVFLLTISSLTPSFRIPLVNIFTLPFTVFTSLGTEVNALVSYHSNYIENERLKKEVGFLQRKGRAVEELSLENNRLKALLSIKQEFPFKVVAAKVIGRDPSNWSSALIINKGSAHGIKRGLVVTGYEGLAGRVLEVSASLSKVMLINDPHIGVSAIVQRSRQEGLVSGSLGGFLTMKYLPKESDISQGDVVITSGLTENYPKGILIGTVVEVGDEFLGLNRYAVIKPAVNLSAIEEVLVYIQ